jgi:class 3 adenylate cyclase
MKRPLLSALIIGLIAGGIVMGLHRSGVLDRPELAMTDLLSRQDDASRKISDKWQYVFVFILALGVAWMTLVSTRRARFGSIVAILLVELVVIAWVCSLYHVLFQPLPSLAGTALGFLMPIGFLELVEFARRRRDRAPGLPPEVVPEKPPARVKRAGLTPDAIAQACEVTAVVCDIANKHDLAEECEPAVFIEITEKFLARASEAFRKAGAYIESAGGEGVVAIFGFPESDRQHAEKATRNAMTLIQTFSDSNKSGQSETPANVGVHAGVSSGVMIMAPMKNNGQRSLLATGEPVELARRFCIANRFYGTRVLLGPRTFELASKILVARPIDFLGGVEVRERHEIYEPVALALDASRDQITRRDAFWNGVVLYREKRWAEAYSQFQNARDPGGEEDRPLQLYLRRLEPLALQLTNTPLEE